MEPEARITHNFQSKDPERVTNFMRIVDALKQKGKNTNGKNTLPVAVSILMVLPTMKVLYDIER